MPFRTHNLSLYAPTTKLKISEWADEYRYLSSESSAEPGKWNTIRAEYQRGMMDAISDETIHTVVILTSAQVGKTEIISNALGYFVHQDPSPILLLQPTLEMAQAFSKDRLSPMIRDTKVLRDRFEIVRTRDTGNTILHKNFTGGHITMAGANSPASLASRPIRVLCMDEVDRYPTSAGTEGDPVNLATKRTTTFWNRKIILTSTPTIKGASRIETAYDESDMRKYHIPCHHCKEHQTLKWMNVIWDDGKPHTAKYQCDHCGAMMTDSQRWAAIAKGKWIAQRQTEGIAGFRLNEIYSPWVRLADMARNFLEAKKSTETLKTFVNTSLGESWEDKGEGIEDGDLDREDYEKVPDQVAVLVCSVDTQDDRIEGEVRGYGIGFESWGIKPFVIYGNPDKQFIWEELDRIRNAEYEKQSGQKIRILCTTVDSGGHFADAVYRYCKKREIERVFAIKGASTPNKPIISRPSTANKAGVKLFSVGTDSGKETVISRIKDGTFHFNAEYDDEWFAQLGAEQAVTRYRHGHPYRIWEKIRKRNEALDISVYGLAAISILNPNFEAILNEKPKKERGERKKSGWVYSGRN